MMISNFLFQNIYCCRKLIILVKMRLKTVVVSFVANFITSHMIMLLVIFHDELQSLLSHLLIVVVNFNYKFHLYCNFEIYVFHFITFYRATPC